MEWMRAHRTILLLLVLDDGQQVDVLWTVDAGLSDGAVLEVDGAEDRPVRPADLVLVAGSPGVGVGHVDHMGARVGGLVDFHADSVARPAQPFDGMIRSPAR